MKINRLIGDVITLSIKHSKELSNLLSMGFEENIDLSNRIYLLPAEEQYMLILKQLDIREVKEISPNNLNYFITYVNFTEVLTCSNEVFCEYELDFLIELIKEKDLNKLFSYMLTCPTYKELINKGTL